MPASISPYLAFEGDAREAMTFYHSVLGGELAISTFADFGAAEAEVDADKVMHSQLTTSVGDLVMGSDVPSTMQHDRGTQQVALFGDDDALLRGWFDGLAAGGQVLEPVTVAPWGDAYGMLVDRFGVLWMVNISPAS